MRRNGALLLILLLVGSCTANATGTWVTVKDKALTCTGAEYHGDAGHFDDGGASCLAAAKKRGDVDYAVWRGDSTKDCYVCAITGRGDPSTWSFESLPGAVSFVGMGVLKPTPPPAPSPPPTPEPPRTGFISFVFSDNAILQRAPQQAVIWGVSTSPGATVSTTFNGRTYSASADTEGTWRQQLPPMPASMTPYNITVSSSVGESASLHNVLFGDVFLCGGQSNMEFALPAVINASAEIAKANLYPNIHIMSVGHMTQSATPLPDLQTIWHPWQVASNTTVAQDAYPGHTLFSTFSAVCWFFGQRISDKLSGVVTATNPTGGPIPVGLVSNNWGGTKVEVWSPPEAFAACGRNVSGDDRTQVAGGGNMYNSMIHPYTVGPMSLSGITWFQGEANTRDALSAQKYACLFPEMIKSWRKRLLAPNLYFGFVQLSTWCAQDVFSLPLLRDAQMRAAELPNVGWATDADRGDTCNIHPGAKQDCGRRLADSALAIIHGHNNAWRSPRYAHATVVANGESGRIIVEIQLNDVGEKGIDTTIFPWNMNPQVHAGQNRTMTNCTMGSVVNNVPNQTANQCAWAGIQVQGHGWLNATVSGTNLTLNASALRLEAFITSQGPAVVTGTAYGWGAIPMMNAYDRTTALPVLPWNVTGL